MCWQCDTYEHSQNCGPLCSDHKYEMYHDMCDEENVYYRCAQCGSIRSEDNVP